MFYTRGKMEICIREWLQVRILFLKLVRQCDISGFSLLGDNIKDTFYEEVMDVLSRLDGKEIAMAIGDLNEHVLLKGAHGGFRYGGRNPEGDRMD